MAEIRYTNLPERVVPGVGAGLQEQWGKFLLGDLPIGVIKGVAMPGGGSERKALIAALQKLLKEEEEEELATALSSLRMPGVSAGMGTPDSRASLGGGMNLAPLNIPGKV